MRWVNVYRDLGLKWCLFNQEVCFWVCKWDSHVSVLNSFLFSYLIFNSQLKATNPFIITAGQRFPCFYWDVHLLTISMSSNTLMLKIPLPITLFFESLHGFSHEVKVLSLVGDFKASSFQSEETCWRKKKKKLSSWAARRVNESTNLFLSDRMIFF